MTETTTKCTQCGRARTATGRDAYDYHPMQVFTGQPFGWYSGDDGELCPECFTGLMGLANR